MTIIAWVFVYVGCWWLHPAIGLIATGLAFILVQKGFDFTGGDHED